VIGLCLAKDGLSETLHCRLSHQAIADSVLGKLETDLSFNKATAYGQQAHGAH
jgi:hypothetical protein